MLTRRQARLLGLTSGEGGGASDSNASSASEPPTGAAEGGLPRVLSTLTARAGPLASTDNQTSPPPFSWRAGATRASSLSISAAASGIRASEFFASATACKPSLQANGVGKCGIKAGSGGSDHACLGICQTEAMLSKAQATIDYWAAASTTTDPSIRFANDLASKQNASRAYFAKTAVRVIGGTSASSASTAGASLEGRAARLTAAQLRTRWRRVTRSCSSLNPSTRATTAGSGVPHAFPKGVNDSHTEQLSTTARLEAPPPSTVFAVEAEASVDMNSGVSTAVVPHADRTHAPPDVAPRPDLLIFTSPFRANVDPSPLSASGAALAAAQALMPPPSPQRIPTRCAAATALALRRRKEDVRAQRQRRLCHEVRYRVYVKAHEARMRLLFGLTSANSGAAVATRSDALAQGCAATASAPPKAVHGVESIIAGEEAYLQSLDPSKSEEQAKVLRVIASIDTALRHQLASAYMHGPPPAFLSGCLCTDQHEHAAGVSTDHLDDSFAVRRPAILEAVIADATQRVEAFTGQLLPYQQEGVRWLLRLNVVEHMNGILADDMGLGKTAQTVVYLACYKEMVEEVVQRPIEKLQQRHARLCQQALGLTTAPRDPGALAGGAGGTGEGELPPWLTWCAEDAAEKEESSRRTKEQQRPSSSALKSRMAGVAQGGSIAAATPLVATDEPASSAATPELAAAHVCGRFIKLANQVKEWLWQLGEGGDKGVIDAGSCDGANGEPYQPLAGYKRRLWEDEESEEKHASATPGVAAALPVKRSRGRPLKNLSAIRVGSAGLARRVASHAHEPESSLLMSRQMERERRTFRPVLIIAPLSTLSHWAGEFQRFGRRYTSASVPPLPAGADAAERFTVYVLNGSRSERESRMKEFLAHVERLMQQPPAPSSASRTDPFLLGKPAAKPPTPVLVIPHDMLTKPLSGALRQIRRVDWHLVAIDEAQRIKCASSALFKKVCELHSVSRLVLTGTPLQNNTMELFSLLRFLASHAFVSCELFEQLDSALLAASQSSALEDRELHILLCRRVHRLLMPFILRREKTILKTALPPIRDYAVLCPLLPFQSAQLEEVQRKHQAGTLTGNPHIQYRKILLHPYTTQAFFYVDEEVVRTSGKLLVLDFMMRFLQRTRHKFLVFCGWTLMLDVVESLCGMRGIPYVRLDGRTSVAQREADIRGFNRPMTSPSGVAEEAGGGSSSAEGGNTACRLRHNSRHRTSTEAADKSSPGADGESDGKGESPLPAAAPCCFLISKVAGGVGLNLQAADTVFLLDVDYNPQRDAQALSRVYRVGQTKEVRVYRLVIDHSIEQGIVAIHEAKDNLSRAVVQAGRYDLHSSVHEREAALRDLFRSGTFSQLSRQWATTARTAGDARGGGGGEAAPVSLASSPSPPFLQYLSSGEGSEASPSPVQTPTNEGGAFLSGGVLAMPSALKKCLKTEIGNDGVSGSVHASDRRTFATGGADLQRTPPPQPSSTSSSSGLSMPAAMTEDLTDLSASSVSSALHGRRRHVSFKSEEVNGEWGDSSANRGDAVADHAGNAKKLVNGAAEPLLFTVAPQQPSMRAAEQVEVAAATATRVLEPAEHLLAMRERLEEVLLRHEGERGVLEEMFRSVEGSLGLGSR
ncbi:hypothetical protein LSCM4_04723 [Leishmania orientalis]|uniref:SNF2 N-terminal domain family protein n=1 Tax=Leishmania orientalis TaxID=2249476 RepID=A0A836KPY6_9TRYP|nr:hypothetical protein LSCM4_04723 [Leishmania orientalis]